MKKGRVETQDVASPFPPLFFHLLFTETQNLASLQRIRGCLNTKKALVSLFCILNLDKKEFFR